MGSFLLHQAHLTLLCQVKLYFEEETTKFPIDGSSMVNYNMIIKIEKLYKNNTILASFSINSTTKPLLYRNIQWNNSQYMSI